MYASSLTLEISLQGNCRSEQVLIISQNKWYSMSVSCFSQKQKEQVVYVFSVIAPYVARKLQTKIERVTQS